MGCMALVNRTDTEMDTWLHVHADRVRDSLLNMVPANTALLAQALAHATARTGKLLRPKITLLAALALGHPITSAIIDAAAVAEMIHVATLLHDDVLDDADLRRGLPTVKHRWGNHVAILAGDYLLAQASLKLSQIGNIELVALFSEVLASLCEGEVSQMQFQYDTQLTMDAYLKKCQMKTGCLFAAAAKAAAILAHASSDQKAHLANFGMAFGVAFQLLDDRLDWVASKESLGKPVMNDLRNGLVTAPVLLATHPQVMPQVATLFQALQTTACADTAQIDALLNTIYPLVMPSLDATQAMAQQMITTALANVTGNTQGLTYLCQSLFP
jgi:all-trans-nonaprenyl-diphosphate synthase